MLQLRHLLQWAQRLHGHLAAHHQAETTANGQLTNISGETMQYINDAFETTNKQVNELCSIETSAPTTAPEEPKETA